MRCSTTCVRPVRAALPDQVLPQVFASYPSAAEIEYALWRRGFTLCRRDLSSLLPLRGRWGSMATRCAGSRRRKPASMSRGTHPPFHDLLRSVVAGAARHRSGAFQRGPGIAAIAVLGAHSLPLRAARGNRRGRGTGVRLRPCLAHAIPSQQRRRARDRQVGPGGGRTDPRSGKNAASITSVSVRRRWRLDGRSTTACSGRRKAMGRGPSCTISTEGTP